MSEILKAILLGVVQGVTEFLPVSSSGHLVIASNIIERATGNILDPKSDLQMNVVLHVGTLFSILWVYRRDLIPLLGKPRLCVAIVVATVPVVIVGFTFREQIEQAFAAPLLVGCGLLVTALVLAVGQRLSSDKLSLDEMSMRSAFVVGLFQAMAVVPGVSRSGSTIAGGMLTGMRREAATSFSFFIAIPAIAGAAYLEVYELALNAISGVEGTHNEPAVLVVALCVSFFVGVFSLKWLLKIVSGGKLHWFAWYCATVGTATIVWQLVA